MSAFLVSRTHVAALVRYWMRYRFAPTEDKMEPERIADLLYAQNVRSVAHRYPEDGPAVLEPPFAFSEVNRAPELPPVAIIKACDCLAYQSCETPDWKQTDAHAALDRIREAAIDSLPGYSDAEWEIADRAQMSA